MKTELIQLQKEIVDDKLLTLELSEYDDLMYDMPMSSSSVHPLFFVDWIDEDALFFTLNRWGPERMSNPDEPTQFELENIEKNMRVNNSQKLFPKPYRTVDTERNNVFGYTILHKTNQEESYDEVIEDASNLDDMSIDDDGWNSRKKYAAYAKEKDILITAKEAFTNAKKQRQLLQYKAWVTTNHTHKQSYLKQANEYYTHMKRIWINLEKIKILQMSKTKLKEYLFKLKDIYDNMSDSNVNRKLETLALWQYAKRIYLNKYSE